MLNNQSKQLENSSSGSNIATRQFYTKRLTLQIKEQEQSIEYTEKSIVTLKSSSFNATFVSTKIEKSRQSISDSHKLIQELEEKMADISLGKYDKEFAMESRTHSKVEEKNKKEKLNMEQKILEAQKEAQEHSNRLNKQDKGVTGEYGMGNQLKYFYSVIDDLPPYITSKLRDMPNNKGWIFRGVYLYGDKNPEEPKNVTTMFERKGGSDLLVIHESHPHVTNIYHKQGNDRNKKLIKSTPRRKIVGSL